MWPASRVNPKNFTLLKSSHTVALASVAGAMEQFVGLVVGIICPPQVLGVAAGNMTVAAGVSADPSLGPRAVNNLAHHVGWLAHFSLIVKPTSPVSALGKRPRKALIAGERCVLHDPTKRNTGRSSAAERVAVSPKPLVVCAAELAPLDCSFAAFNGAFLHA